jgi:hypothetical protein
MARGCGLLLLALGVLGCVLGGIGVIIGLGELQRGGAAILIGFALLAAVGIACLAGGIALMRRTKPWVGPTSGEGTDRYPANQSTSHDLDGVAYSRLYTPPVKGKNAKPSVLTFSTKVACRGEFEMVVETGFDRLCKSLKIAVELQTGDAKFDDACYIRSDTPAFAEAYLADPLKRTAIINLREFGFLNITLKDGTLSAVRTGFDPVADGRHEFDADVAARLVLLSRNLPEHKPEFDDRTGAHRKMWQTVLWVLLIGFALTATSLFSYPPIQTTELLVRALAVLLAWPVFAYLSAWLLSGTSRSHLAWAGLMTGSLILFPLGSGGAIGLLNGVLDDSPQTAHDAVILEKYTSRSKNKTKYHVRCASWRLGGRTLSFEISSADYNAVVPHKSKMVVVTRAGGLGVEWLKSRHLEVAPKP